MCVVSTVSGHFYDKGNEYSKLGKIVDVIWLNQTVPVGAPALISQEEIAEFRKLLERAREYDKKNHEPHCELQEKKDRLKKLAAELGVDISFIDEQ